MEAGAAAAANRQPPWLAFFTVAALLAIVGLRAGRGGGAASAGPGDRQLSAVAVRRPGGADDPCGAAFRRAAAATGRSGAALPLLLQRACPRLEAALGGYYPNVRQRFQPCSGANESALVEAARRRRLPGFFELVPCDWAALLRGRTLWLVGDRSVAAQAARAAAASARLLEAGGRRRLPCTPRPPRASLPPAAAR